MTGDERPDIYADGLREERCENCSHCGATVLRTIHGVERTEYECGRSSEFVHRMQADDRSMSHLCRSNVAPLSQ